MVLMSKNATLAVGRREILAMLGGALLYGGISWITNVFPLAGAAGVDIRPGVVVPIFFGFLFGPLVGFVTGTLGNFLADLWSGYLAYPPDPATGNLALDLVQGYLLNWQAGNGLMGLIPGLLALFNRRYFSFSDQLRALAFSALGIVVGMGFASFTDIPLDNLSFNAALFEEFIPAVKVNIVNAVILVPILLFNYERLDLQSTGWIRSGLMQRLLIAILISAALPVALLGFLLVQQTTGVKVGLAELWVKLGFIILLTLLFTIANTALLAQSMSRPLLRLTRAARLMEAGQLTGAQAAELKATEAKDEIRRLTQIFGQMAQEVILREEKLRRQVEELRIEIDEFKRQKQVREIVETDFFRDLQAKAREMRRRSGRQTGNAPEDGA
jgi:energy-coupling factor transport system substrate-specific component